MLAALRPDSFDLPLFLHVLGATLLFGSTATVAIAGYASRRTPDNSALLARVVAGTWVLVILPSFILMRAGAAWIVDKEFPGNASEPGWVGVGFIVSEPGALLLIAVGILAWVSVRKKRVLLAVPILASIYLLALAVAWFAMAGKP
ncbi:MAG TPA: PEP-CTERM sorting domain-containing protein [Gaiellaceae bacterium]|nr:PEP-CTERM sorting domain-containing protein [Gaiellaceae bacterium]